MKKTLIAAALLALPLSGVKAMDVATFLARSEVAQRKGMAAMFSSEARSLFAEVRTAFKALKAERLAAEGAGRRPAYCPKGKAELSQKELLAGLRAVPPAERSRVEVKDALRNALARKYPCAG